MPSLAKPQYFRAAGIWYNFIFFNGLVTAGILCTSPVTTLQGGHVCLYHNQWLYTLGKQTLRVLVSGLYSCQEHLYLKQLDDDTTNIGWKWEHSREIDNLAVVVLGKKTIFALNINKTKQLIVDFRKGKIRYHASVFTGRAAMECVNNFKFLSVYISDSLTCAAQWCNQKECLQMPLLPTYSACYRIHSQRSWEWIRSRHGWTEIIPTGCIVAWFGHSQTEEQRGLQTSPSPSWALTSAPLKGTTCSTSSKAC